MLELEGRCWVCFNNAASVRVGDGPAGLILAPMKTDIGFLHETPIASTYTTKQEHKGY